MALPDRDTVALTASAVTFSVAMGIATVALPLLALEAGYTGVQVGVFVALTGLTQLGARLGMGAWMNRFPDWTFVLASMVLIGVSNTLAALSTSVVPFVIAHLLQGVARAFFHTGAQTHAVRGTRPAIKGMALVTLSSSVGLLLGPVIAGTLGTRSLALAMAVGAFCAVFGMAATLLLDRLPPFKPPADRTQRRMWRRPGVDAGCWAGVSAGAWRGLLNSYVPVALSTAGLSAAMIGALIAIANAAQLGGSLGVARFAARGQARLIVAGTLAAGAGTALVGFVAAMPAAAALALAFSALGAGVLQTAGPAVASDSVHPEERGAVIATAGTFRSAALLAVPLGAAAVVAVAPVSTALLLGGVLIAGPTRAALQLTRRLGG